MGDKKWKVVFGADGSVSDDEVYSQRVTIFNSKSEVIGIFKGSSTPNPFKRVIHQYQVRMHIRILVMVNMH